MFSHEVDETAALDVIRSRPPRDRAAEFELVHMLVITLQAANHTEA
jgi:hypothetical protein